MEREATYVGIDVAKAKVDVAVRPTGRQMGRFPMTRQEPGSWSPG